MIKSESIVNLTLALCAFQSEVQDIVKDSEGYGYSYASLAEILSSVRPLLTKNGLFVSAHCANSPENPTVVGLETMILHSSGEFMGSTLNMLVEPRKGMSHCQSSGTSISYMRRYAICSALNLVTVDDDASKEQDTSPATKPKPKVELTEKQKLFNEVVAQAKAKNVTTEEGATWIARFGVAKLIDSSEEQLKEILDLLAGR